MDTIPPPGDSIAPKLARKGFNLKAAATADQNTDTILQRKISWKFYRFANMNPNSLELARSEDDYYTILGCAESSSVDQIMAEYRIRALKCHPDKHPDDTDCLEQFQRLQEAKEVLCDPTKRKDYDKFRSGGLSISWKQWNSIRNSATPVWHWAVPKTDGRMLISSEGNQPTNHSQKPPRPTHTNKNWESVPNSEFIRKFRNYEI